ncbi:Anthocyanidin reductase-like [Quillaja saponaria]|uniref:Anthocyanidin reductase-like n=1 Tax=Quillaja saponaria TaxID=32244 RepID=A0AAD7LQL1_QUISA|nr:Anthocyanidin reductase-like [Quillaja saponaria]
MEKHTKVCVTGGSSFLGSWLIKKLLQKGYTVQATLRNLADPVKSGLLKGLPNADTLLRLFEADIYNADEFGRAIQGCHYVIHMATPLQHDPSKGTQFKDTSEAAVAGIKSIVQSCIRSGTVKRLIYTASVVAASPLKEDGTGFKDSVDESCWTPLNIPFKYSIDVSTAYVHSKTLSEKEVFTHSSEIEIVSIACGLVGGDSLVSPMPQSMGVLISQPTKNKTSYQMLRFMEELLGKVPFLHIEDVCEAHIFCIEHPSINGRFLCANSYLTSADIAGHFQENHPDINLHKEFVENSRRTITWGSTKLKDIGFECKFDAKVILDDTLKYAQKIGEFDSYKGFT